MVVCTNCGSENPQESSFCGVCGEEIDKTVKEDSGRSKGVSDTNAWFLGVITGLVGWLVVLMMIESASDGLVGSLLLLVWVGLPIATYKDIQVVKKKTSWTPSTALWVVLSALWFVNIPSTAVYIYKRMKKS